METLDGAIDRSIVMGVFCGCKYDGLFLSRRLGFLSDYGFFFWCLWLDNMVLGGFGGAREWFVYM